MNKIVLSNPYIIIFLAGSILSFILELFLDFTNWKHRKRFGGQLPEELKEFPASSVFDKEKLSKMTSYKNDKFYLSLPFSCLAFALNLSLVLSGFYPWIFNLVCRVTGAPHSWLNTWLCALFFSFLTSLPQALLSLPLGLIDEFKLEKKYGFSNMTLKMWILDGIKSLVLSALLSILIFAAVVFILTKFPSSWWIFITVLLFAFTILMQVLYPLVIAPIFNKFTPLEDGELKSKISELLQSQGFKVSGIFVMDASKRSGHSNAYFGGFGKSKRIVLYDTLIQNLTTDELVAVIGHELGHAKLHHITKKMFFLIPVELLLMLLLNYTSGRTSLYTGFGFAVSQENVVNMQFIGLFLSMMVWSSISTIITPIQNFFSRKDEFAADNFSAEHAKNPDQLISGLIKLNSDNLSELIPSKIYAAWYYSHPSLLERIRALKKKEKDN